MPSEVNALLEQVAALPTLPGVYRFFDDKGALLYVGKARSLRQRVRSYFRLPPQQSGTRIAHMVSKIARMETTVVRSEVEALLLESNLIKRDQPRYNIVFRDDKSYPYLRLSNHDIAPRISYYRGKTDKRNRYFGPYPSAAAVKQTIELLQKVFLLRTCDDGFFAHRSRPCLLYQIKRCSAPCVGAISPQDYAADVEAAAALLSGKAQELLTHLQQRMHALAEAQQYEQAAQIRNQISALAQVLDPQSMLTQAEQDADIIAVQISQGLACVNLAVVRGGRHLGDRAYFPSNETQDGEQAVLSAFIAQHYSEHPVPDLLILSQPLDELLIQALNHQAQPRRVQVLTQPRNQRKTWLELAQQGAALQLQRRLEQRSTAHQRCTALAHLLNAEAGFALDPKKMRIECFDISHSAGEAAQASCVVFAQQQMQPSQYRRFNIQGVGSTMSAGDDYAAMRQVLTRRYEVRATHMPDLVLIDGGVGQVSSAKAVFERLGLDTRCILGVQKGEGRKVGLEELVFAHDRPNLVLGTDSPALMLIAQIRDEAHRFAITGMRSRRARARTGAQSSSLEGISGIGAKRRARLLAHFGSVRGVSSASIEQLQSVEGISRALAERIYLFCHGRAN